jgi:hypothetical protein
VSSSAAPSVSSTIAKKLVPACVDQPEVWISSLGRLKICGITLPYSLFLCEHYLVRVAIYFKYLGFVFSSFENQLLSRLDDFAIVLNMTLLSSNIPKNTILAHINEGVDKILGGSFNQCYS